MHCIARSSESFIANKCVRRSYFLTKQTERTENNCWEKYAHHLKWWRTSDRQSIISLSLFSTEFVFLKRSIGYLIRVCWCYIYEIYREHALPSSQRFRFQTSKSVRFQVDISETRIVVLKGRRDVRCHASSEAIPSHPWWVKGFHFSVSRTLYMRRV